MKNFVLIGVGGFVAPRHLQAIRGTGNNLLAALDKHDSVGILDSYFPEADFFVEFERFDRHIEMLKRKGINVDYVSVCSPNYLHDAHIRFGLRIGADVICEKPVVLNPWNVEALIREEKEWKRKVNVIQQLRLHPTILALRDKVRNSPKGHKYKVELNYITVRGNWYQYSWKGDVHKSGGVVTNIGLHLLDMALWIFGGVKESIVEKHTEKTASGTLELENATVKWFVSTDPAHLPAEKKAGGQRSHRSIVIDGDSMQFDNGFDELHNLSYQQILSGNGVSLEESLPVIKLAHQIRSGLK